MLVLDNIFRKSKVFGFIQTCQQTDDAGWIEYITSCIHETYEDIGRKFPGFNLHDDDDDPLLLNFLKEHEEWTIAMENTNEIVE